MKSVRWNIFNADALCFGCHRYLEKENREEYRDMKLQQLGEYEFNRLRIAAQTPKSGLDEKLAEITYKALLKKEFDITV